MVDIFPKLDLTTGKNKVKWTPGKGDSFWKSSFSGLFTEAFLVDYSTERFQAMNKGLAEKGPISGCPRNFVSMVSYNPLKYMGYIEAMTHLQTFHYNVTSP